MIIQPSLTFEQISQSKINSLISSKNTINQNYNDQIAKVQGDYSLGKISEDEKNNKIDQLNNSRNDEVNTVNSDINTLTKQINISSSDVYKNVNNKQKQSDNNISTSIKNNSGTISKAKSELTSKITSNITKSLVPTLALQLTNQLTNIGGQSKKIDELVDNTNILIENIKTQDDINKAKTSRDSTINIINNNEQSILGIKSTLSQLSEFLSIFNLLISTLSSLPIPVSTPPGVGLPMSIILGISKQIENSNKLVLGINTLLAICIPILTKMVSDLEIQKSRIETINGLLDDSTTSTLSPDQLQDFINSITNNTTDLGSYKGFTFILKEEENPQFVVAGNKRHYAVALDSDGVPVLQSEYSFTLDPNVLVSQLELLIDQNNMIS